MLMLDLSIDELLTTTRSVRKRLDLARPVEAAVIQQCLSLALQAPTAGAQEHWHFVVVTDPALRSALAALYRKVAAPMLQQSAQWIASATDEKEAASRTRMADTSQYLMEHLHEVPVHVIPCIQGRTENRSLVEQASFWGSILPATWSFMLAARSRGLGTVLTNFHLFYEKEAANILDIPHEQITQTGLIPVAYTLGTTFKPAARKPLDQVLHWNRW
ncbi:putative oxidoreductase [Reticulibacter mediterranei]|uniref:Putative oxidoreductase n=1 Tax=Reticulibacter mediterranei TaxID=2778369 RepID=A0A8J3ILG3_9CHLR|nr:nitroreductase family protein [Reticulibacter mediterranei]GHO93694.1 putative oxidoreductase [Reticulibacter mediterranei]